MTESVSAIDVHEVSKAFGSTSVLRNVSLRAEPGEVIALLGPSGCGKTTLLRLIAGLERPDTGSITLGNQTVVDGRRFVPPDKRGIGLVFQDYALFPQRTVADNIAFGLRGLSKPERASRVQEVLHQVDLPGLGTRYPHELSGGQQQRVALARAMAPRPAVLLLDEPFSNLDAALRRRLRLEMGRLLKTLAVTTVFVTHDQDEALSLATRVAVMSDGQIAQLATAEEVYSAPATLAVARSVGEANIIRAQAADGWGSSPIGRIPCEGASGAIDVVVRPEQLEVAPPVDGSEFGSNSELGPDAVAGEVHASEYLGRERHLLVKVPDHEPLVAVLCSNHNLATKIDPGMSIFLRLREGARCRWFGV